MVWLLPILQVAPEHGAQDSSYPLSPAMGASAASSYPLHTWHPWKCGHPLPQYL